MSSTSAPVTPDPSPASGAGFAISFASRRLRLPSYSREALTPGVVHLGLGGFHRSHQAVYFDELAHAGWRDWGLVSASVRSRSVVDVLRSQHGLYTVMERGGSGESARVVGSIGRCMFGPEAPDALTDLLADEQTRLVTLTLTGDAYDAESAPSSSPSATNAWDYVVAALARRRSAGIPPFTVLSCDNIPANGDAARTAVLRTARARDELLTRWIAREVAFPQSMVDRITPSPTDDQEEHLLEEFGISDRCSVVAEPFSQWVIEDAFCNERPPLDRVGVQFVPDVRPYGLTKNRLLNAGHSAIGYLGLLAGHRWTDQAMRDPLMVGYLQGLMAKEIAPLLPRVPGIDLPAYQRQLVERFSNPAIRDPLSRLAGRGSTKMPAYLLPSIHDARRRGGSTSLLTLAVAGWIRCLRGTGLDSQPLQLKESRFDELHPLACHSTDPRPLLAKRDIFGDLIDDQAFVDELRQALVGLDARGVHGLLESDPITLESCAA